MSHVTIYFSPFLMSLSPMSHVEFKKWSCRPVDFRGQGPSLCLESVLSPHFLGVKFVYPLPWDAIFCYFYHGCMYSHYFWRLYKVYIFLLYVGRDLYAFPCTYFTYLTCFFFIVVCFGRRGRRRAGFSFWGWGLLSYFLFLTM